MQINTRKSVLAALVASLAVSLAAPMASAQGTHSACVLLPDGMRKCDGPSAQKTQSQKAQPSQKSQPAQKATGQKIASPAKSATPAKSTPQKVPAPHVGDSARKGALFQQAKNSRLPAPPAHQHYRVVDNTVVRVDDSTLKVVAVVGLLSTILNSN